MEGRFKLAGPAPAGACSWAAPAPWPMKRDVPRGGEPMNSRKRVHVLVSILVACAAAVLATGSARAQVSPGEITNPKLKAVEQEYLPQLRSLQHAIGEARFPLPFILTRYVGKDPDRQASLDTRGLEFVYFQNQMLLKTSGFYSAAYNSDDLTANQRAGRTVQEVVIPILRLMVQQVPPDMECDGIGFEIAYHVRAARRNSDFEGREILAVVLDRADAFALAAESGNAQRQAILNRSTVYLDGEPLGLALGQRDALELEALGRLGSGEREQATISPASTFRAWFAGDKPRFAPAASSAPSHDAPARSSVAGVTNPVAPPPEAKTSATPADPKAPATAADVEKLQAQFQPQLDALVKEEGANLSLVNYAPPSFAVYHKQSVLQFTLRNPLAFDSNSSSIYKRAAQSFDLFLAPKLKAFLAKLPADLPVEALDFSILNRLGNQKDSSEAVEFVCPLGAVRSFADDQITSQELIDRSVVLSNGVRINLHLELVE